MKLILARSLMLPYKRVGVMSLYVDDLMMFCVSEKITNNGFDCSQSVFGE